MKFARPVFVTRRVSFSAAHRYHNPTWNEEKNRQVFGPCNHRYGHGHNYELEATVVGDVDPETGMVMNLRDLDAVLKEVVVARLDHRHLNEELPEWKENIPTTENLAVDLWRRLAPRLERPNAQLFRVRLYESATLFAEYYGSPIDQEGQEDNADDLHV